MSAMTIDKPISWEPASRGPAGRHHSPRFDLAQKSAAGLALEAAGHIVLRRPRTTSFIVISLALVLGSLAGMSLGAFGRVEPPPLVRLVALKPHPGALRAGTIPAGYDLCQPSRQASCRIPAAIRQNADADAP